MLIKGRIPSLLVLVASLSLSAIAPAQASSAQRSQVATHHSNNQVTPAALARFNAKITTLTQAHTFSGTVLVAQGDTVLLRKGYGMADQDQQIHNSSTTTFNADNLLHEFSVVAVLQFEDAGKVHDQDRLCAYLPHCPATWSSITIHELLNGTAGFHDITQQPTLGESLGQSYTVAQAAGYAMREPLAHKPGSAVDPNWVTRDVVSEYLVEQITGAPFSRYIQDHFLQPLGLSHTGFYLHAVKLARHAMGYQFWQIPADSTMESFDMSLIGGAVYSTVDDAFRWEHALDTSKIFSAASTADLLTPTYTWCHSVATCGNGLMNRGTSEGRFTATWQNHPVTFFSFQIEQTGFEDATDYFADANLTLIFLTNLTGSLENLQGADRLLFS